MKEIILIRHGETDHNKNRVYCGTSDPPLNGTGVRQAQRLRRRLSGRRIDRLYTSCLTRAIQTAEIAFEGMDAERLSDFNEIGFGLFEGLDHAEIMALHGNDYRKWISDPIGNAIPGAEETKDFFERVKRGFSGVTAGRAAIITHGGPIRAILCMTRGLGMRSFWSIVQDNCAWNLIECGAGARPNIVSVNDISHL